MLCQISFWREIVPFECGEAYVLPPVVQQIEVENTALLLLTGVLMCGKLPLSFREGYHHKWVSLCRTTHPSAARTIATLHDKELSFLFIFVDALTGEKRGLIGSNQCFGSVTFWYGSGSSDSYLWLTDPDPDQASSCRWPSRRQQKNIVFSLSFYATTFWRYIYIILQR